MNKYQEPFGVDQKSYGGFRRNQMSAKMGDLGSWSLMKL